MKSSHGFYAAAGGFFIAALVGFSGAFAAEQTALDESTVEPIPVLSVRAADGIQLAEGREAPASEAEEDSSDGSAQPDFEVPDGAFPENSEGAETTSNLDEAPGSSSSADNLIRFTGVGGHYTPVESDIPDNPAANGYETEEEGMSEAEYEAKFGKSTDTKDTADKGDTPKDKTAKKDTPKDDVAKGDIKGDTPKGKAAQGDKADSTPTPDAPTPLVAGVHTYPQQSQRDTQVPAKAKPSAASLQAPAAPPVAPESVRPQLAKTGGEFMLLTGAAVICLGIGLYLQLNSLNLRRKLQKTAR